MRDREHNELAVGDVATLTNLKSKPELNGKRVNLIEFVSEKNRWQVRLLHTGPDGEDLSIQSMNLAKIPCCFLAPSYMFRPAEEVSSLDEDAEAKLLEAIREELHSLTATVTDVAELEDHVEYRIMVSTVHQYHTVRTRFSEFKSVIDDLIKSEVLPATGLPRLPTGGLLQSKKSPALVAQRRDAFNQLLSVIVKEPALSCPIVRNFLQVASIEEAAKRREEAALLRLAQTKVADELAAAAEKVAAEKCHVETEAAAAQGEEEAAATKLAQEAAAAKAAETEAAAEQEVKEAALTKLAQEAAAAKAAEVAAMKLAQEAAAAKAAVEKAAARANEEEAEAKAIAEALAARTADEIAAAKATEKAVAAKVEEEAAAAKRRVDAVLTRLEAKDAAKVGEATGEAEEEIAEHREQLLDASRVTAIAC